MPRPRRNGSSGSGDRVDPPRMRLASSRTLWPETPISVQPTDPSTGNLAEEEHAFAVDRGPFREPQSSSERRAAAHVVKNDLTAAKYYLGRKRSCANAVGASRRQAARDKDAGPFLRR